MGKSISIAIDYNSYENRVIENYLRDNADRIIRSLKLILIGLSRDTPVGLCGHVGFVCSRYTLNTRCQKVVVVKGAYGSVKFNI